MKLTEERRAQTGAFYTPKMWADKAVEYMQDVLGELTQYVFYDPAAGEGALLESLPANCEKFASTLEWQDVEILRQKGINAVQFDFLREENIRLLPYEIIAPRKPLVIFTNPPYLKLGKEDAQSYAYHTYRGASAGDSVALFLLRALYELSPKYICTFSKLDIMQASSFKDFRYFFTMRYKRGFITPTFSWPGLKGNWPVGFSIWG